MLAWGKFFLGLGLGVRVWFCNGKFSRRERILIEKKTIFVSIYFRS